MRIAKRDGDGNWLVAHNWTTPNEFMYGEDLSNIAKEPA